MQFQTPTTLEQLHQTLKEIFHYYRVTREGFVAPELQPLELNRLKYEEVNDSVLEAKASTLVGYQNKKDYEEFCLKLRRERAELQGKLSALDQNKQVLEEKVNSLHEESVRNIQLQAIKNGLNGSNILMDKIAYLEEKKNQELSKITADYLSEKSSITSLINYIDNEIEHAEILFDQMLDKMSRSKLEELKDEQEKISMQVFKYNNSLDEKEQRYQNGIAETEASLRIRYLEINAREYTDDELIEMGYYKDVIECVCAYYDRFEPMEAAINIKDDKEIVIYLGKYYESVLYKYLQTAITFEAQS